MALFCLVAITCFQVFECGIPARQGTDVDARNLFVAATKMGFEYVRIFRSLTKEEILNWVNQSMRVRMLLSLTHYLLRGELIARHKTCGNCSFRTRFSRDRKWLPFLLTAFTCVRNKE